MIVRTTPDTGDEVRRSVLAVFARAVRRETHVLATRPDLLWQQLFDRLQWEIDPVPSILQPELLRRSAPDAAPWLRTGTRPRESDALVRTLTGHVGEVTGCAVSPDGTWIVSTGSDRTLRIWDAATGAERAALIGHTDRVKACAIGPDGTWIVSASDDKTLRIWDVATGLERGALTGHTNWVNGCAVSPDGSWVVSTSDDQSVRVWDVATMSERNCATSYDGWERDAELEGCAVSPDGTWFVTASHDRTLTCRDVAVAIRRPTLMGHTDLVRGCAVSPDGTWVVSASWDGTLRTWDAVSGTERATLRGHVGKVDTCAVSPDGSWIVSGGTDDTVRMWDVATGAERATFVGHAASVTACAVSPDATWIVSAAGDSLKIWDVATGIGRATLPGHAERVTGCAVSPDGSWVASVSGGSVMTWDAETGAERAAFPGHGSWMNDCAIGPGGSWIATASNDRTIMIRDAASGAERATLAAHTGVVTACAVNPDGSWIVSASDDGSLRIWDAGTYRERACLLSGQRHPLDCAISPDACWIVSADYDHTLRIWDIATGTERATLTGHTGYVTACAVSPDGTWIVSASSDGTLKMWDPATGAIRATLSGHDGVVSDCAVGADGSWIVSSGWDGTVRFWDVASGLERAVLIVDGGATAVAAHPSEAMVVCGDSGGGVHLAHLVGIDLGSLIVTGLLVDDRVDVRCPACREAFRVELDRLGSETACPRPACGRTLRINGFVVRSHAGMPSLDEADQALADIVTPTLEDLIEGSGLRYTATDEGDLAMTFAGTRAERIVVHAKTLEAGLAFLAVALPGPGRFGGEAALRSLLSVSFRADYVKALVFPDGELALACEQQPAFLSPTRVRGLVAGLAALGDIRKGDLADAAGWDRRLATCRLAQGDVSLDPAAATAAIRSLAAGDGLSVHDSADGILVVDLDLLAGGLPLRLVVRAGDRVVSIIAFLNGVKPHGDKSAYLRRMLELNRSADVARIALDGDGDVALLYEVPEVGPDLFDRIREQFGPLLFGVLALDRGRSA